MRYLKVIIVIMMMGVLLVGCGKSEITNLDINKTSAVIEKKLSGMKKVEDSTLETVYNFDLSKFEEYVIKENDDGDMYAIIKTSDKSGVNDCMNEYFSKIKDFNKAYSPERLEILEDRMKKEIGDYLIYLVSKDNDDIYQEIINSME